MNVIRYQDRDYLEALIGQSLADPTGFIDPRNIGRSYDPNTRTITLTHPSGKIKYFFNGGFKELNSPWVSPAHDDVLGFKYYLFSTDGVNFTWATSPWEFYNIQVASALYTATDKFGLAECHGIDLPWMVHDAFHSNFGTRRVSGLDLTAGTYQLAPTSPTDADNTFGINGGEVLDEDLPTLISALTEGNYTLLKFTGAGTPVYTKGSPLPISYNVGNSKPYYNPVVAGTFTDAELDTGKFTNIYILNIPVTDDAASQAYRFLILQGQFMYSTPEAAKNENPRSLNLGTLISQAAEYAWYVRILIKHAASYTSTGKFRLEDKDYIAGTRENPILVRGLNNIDSELVNYINTLEGVSITTVKQALDLLISKKFNVSEVSANVNPAVPYTIYLVNSEVNPITVTLPDVIAGDRSEYRVVMVGKSHKVNITTVGGSQLIGGSPNQLIPTYLGMLYLKANGVDGYTIITDTRVQSTVTLITSDRDFSTDGVENNVSYLIDPQGLNINIILSEPSSLLGDRSIKCTFVLNGEGTVTFGTVAGTTLIGDKVTQLLSVKGTSFTLLDANSKYYLLNDTRPKLINSRVVSYSLSEDSTITDPLRGAFFKQRCTSIEDPRYDKNQATLVTSPSINANPADPYQLLWSSITDEGIFYGIIPEGNIVGKLTARLVSGVPVLIQGRYFKRASNGDESLIANTSNILVSSATMSELAPSSAIHPQFTMEATDRIILRVYAKKSTNGTNSVIEMSLENDAPSRSEFDIPVSVLAHNTTEGRQALDAHPSSSITHVDTIDEVPTTTVEEAIHLLRDRTTGGTSGTIITDSQVNVTGVTHQVQLFNLTEYIEVHEIEFELLDFDGELVSGEYKVKFDSNANTIEVMSHNLNSSDSRFIKVEFTEAERIAYATFTYSVSPNILRVKVVDKESVIYHYIQA